MEWLNGFLAEIFPLYLIAIIGFITGKFAKIDLKTVSTLAIFVLSPIVFMLSLSKLDFTAGAIIAPLLIFIIAVVLAPIMLKITSLYLDRRTPYITALMSGTNNWGYFGLPIAFALLEPEMVAAYIVLAFGTQFFENTMGIYYASRGSKSPKESFLNMFRYPVIYAILAGLFLSYISYDLPDIGENFLSLFKGAYTVLGMMMIGIALAQIDRFRIDLPFISSIFILRFLIWPAIALGIIWADQHIYTLLGEQFYKPLLLFSVMPVGANNIGFAAQFDIHPGKVSMAVLLTTLFALIYIPFAVWIFEI